MKFADRITRIPRPMAGLYRGQVEAYKAGHADALAAAAEIASEADAALANMRYERDQFAADLRAARQQQEGGDQ